MDNGRGTFDKIDSEHFKEMIKEASEGNSSRLDKVFYEGEQVQIKQSKFLIRSIDHFTGIMTLKLLPEKKF
jgi:hypothetical protein